VLPSFVLLASPRERQSCSCDIQSPHAGPMCCSRGVAIWRLAGVADRFAAVAIGPEGRKRFHDVLHTLVAAVTPTVSMPHSDVTNPPLAD
jgi:hypothetical protein